jgi:hypothetical protein
MEYGMLYQGGAAGVAAFGTATAPGAIPVSGSATYLAVPEGITVDGNGAIDGSATLQFDFASGKLAGHFDPVFVSYGGMGEGTALGRYEFVSTVYGVGSTSFSGQLSNGQVPDKGSFNGIFTGPHAEELMARWSAPYVLAAGQTPSTMFGVWVGKH